MLKRLCTEPMTKSSRSSTCRRVVERAVLEDIRLDALEDANAVEPRVDRVDLGPLALEVIGAQPAGVRRRLAVIGDADVAVALLPGRRAASCSTVLVPSL